MASVSTNAIGHHSPAYHDSRNLRRARSATVRRATAMDAMESSQTTMNGTTMLPAYAIHRARDRPNSLVLTSTSGIIRSTHGARADWYNTGTCTSDSDEISQI